MKTNACWAASAAVISLALGWSMAADPKASTNADEVFKAAAEAGRPGPEHAKLAPLAGSWTYTSRFWMGPNQPPIETKGVVERKWILGGRFLEERVNGTGFDGKPGFEAVGLLGYNNSAEQYVSTSTCSMSTGLSSSVGTATAPGTFTFQSKCACPLSKEPVQRRDVIRIESEDRVVMESFMNVDGSEAKLMEFVSVRKK
jgi:hypothetical protein